MFRLSLINQSGQLWKFWLALLALLIGSFAPLAPAAGIGWTAGSIIALAGYGFGLFAIRCDHCKSMWFWEAAKDAALYAPIFKGQACPGCQHDFS